jgi:hypothetical protein
LSIKSVIQNFFPVNFYRNSQSFEQNVDNLKGPLRGFGHTFGVRVDGTSSRRFLRFLDLTALRAEGDGGGFAAGKKRGAAGAAGCVEGLHKKGS